MDPKRSEINHLRTATRPWARAAALAGLLILCISAARSEAAGLLIADGGLGGVLEIESHDVTVLVDNGIAVTTVEQVFRNTESRQVEALYTFPVPARASVANFSMWIGGKEMVGEVLEKQRAREIYQSYKAQRRDPGLLEQVDFRTFEMRIFPIAPRGEQRVRITYYQELTPDQDFMTYVYPLATVTRPGVDAHTKGRFSFNLSIQSQIPILKVQSPSHSQDVAIVRHGDARAEASLERTAGEHLNRDIVIACQIARPHTGVDILTHREKELDGTFSLTLTAGKERAQLDEGMDFVFVLDVSGSMGDAGKLVVSQESVAAFLGALGPKDRFEVLAFNVQASELFSALSPTTPDNQQKARSFLASQQARGGTVLLPALTAAYRHHAPDRTLNVVILSDGLTEQSERQALLQSNSSRPADTRIFCIGVGNDVNKPLLEQLAEEAGGLASFVSAGDDFTRQAQAFRAKLLRPVATDLALELASGAIFDLEPQQIPNLYHGAPVRVYGRYRQSGEVAVTLRGKVQGKPFSEQLALKLPEKEGSHPEIERMWASRRIARLLKDADRAGDRTKVVDEVVRLGEAFSIASEYTSFIVLENDAEYQRWKIERRNALLVERDRQALERRHASADALRRLAVPDIGPNVPSSPSAPITTASPVPNLNPSAPRQTAQSRGGSSWDLPLGSGPVGPLFVAVSAWLARRRRKS
jgi:Ca-activated chloride channel homolog